MKQLLDVAQMTMITKEARIRIIKKLGTAINAQYACNLTEEIVVELVLLIDPKNDILSDPHYSRFNPTHEAGTK